MEGFEETTHPSYGMCSVARRNGHPIPLFGANVKHGNTLSLRISTASVQRGLNQDWYHPNQELIEIEMSGAQFTEMITNTNTIGVPVTIRHIQHERMGEPPFQTVISQFNKEYEVKMRALSDDFNMLKSQSKAILSAKKTPNKSEKETIVKALDSISNKLSSSLPFIHKQFVESVDKTMNEAKVAIDSYHMQRIIELGQDAYQKELSAMDNPQLEIKA